MTLETLFAGPDYCLKFVPESTHRDLYAALVCGVNLDGGEVKALFVDSGLIHILVVSGAHLVTIERLTKRWPIALTSAALAGYAWLTGFGAPIVRAGVARVIRSPAGARGFSTLQIEFLTSALIVVAYPPWLASRSFLMSWLCVLALKTPLPRTRWPALTDGLRCYVLLYPFSLSHPLTVLWNCVVAPLIGGILFPLAAAACVLPYVATGVDFAWSALLWLLRVGPRAAPEGGLIVTAWLWWLPWVTHTLLMYVEYSWRRARAFF